MNCQCLVYGNCSQSGIKSFSKASQELDMIEDMAESVVIGRRFKCLGPEV